MYEKEKADFLRKGYAIVPNFLDVGEDMEQLRGECSHVVAGAPHHSVDSCIYEPRRAIEEVPLCERPTCVQRLVGRLAQVAAVLLEGRVEDVLLLHEQYIAKPPHSPKSAFSWHFDSENVADTVYTPYASFWVCLDDVKHENGTLQFLPFSEGHRMSREQATALLSSIMVKQEYEGFDEYLSEHEAETISAGTGSLVILSDTVLHRSFPNKSARFRRYVHVYK
uniref:Phytanoyl-CoA dioxygenase n=1 Tax=Palpitomonas bilix TaxID=652834 RepID=A0A7S3LXK6_9EUKA|mmetsp:Transcript_9067/g.24636  ORF Transcript_9067/g.24636 Transcript_9067/m.24636 type:complete len:223 (+) Transcript_9067:83-751(+)